MYSILKAIDKHIKSQNIPFKGIRFSYTYFPQYLNQALLEKLREINKRENLELGSHEYRLDYDENGELYLLIESSDYSWPNSNKIVISNSKDCLKIDFGATRIDESNLIEEAYLYEQLNSCRDIIKSRIKKKADDIPLVKKVKIESLLMRKVINQELIARKKKGRVIIDEATCNAMLKPCVERITAYIDHVYGIYEDDMKQKAFLIDRLNILNEYQPVYSNYSYDGKSNKPMYINYLYYFGNGEFTLFMEPYDSSLNSKIVVFNREKLSHQEFAELTKYYAGLSDYLQVPDGNLLTISHTTIEDFANVVKDTLTPVDRNNLKKKTLEKEQS